MKHLLVLAALLSTPALAQTPLLKPAPLSEACQLAGYRVWTDPQGAPRVLRHRVNIPDNTRSTAQYYDARGRLLTLRASFNGFVGPVYDLTARLDGQGRIISESGFRAAHDHTDLRGLIVNVRDVLAGRCPV